MPVYAKLCVCLLSNIHPCFVYIEFPYQVLQTGVLGGPSTLIHNWSLAYYSDWFSIICKFCHLIPMTKKRLNAVSDKQTKPTTIQLFLQRPWCKI